MRKALFFFISFFSLQIQGQDNLVLNPSFEDTLSMTTEVLTPLCLNWWSPDQGTSDYCTPYFDVLLPGWGAYRSVPCNTLGCLDAHDGQAYLGLVTYHSTGVGKEWAQGLLSEPLVSGETYCISVWLASGDSCGFVTCDFHVALTENSYNDSEHYGSFGFPNAISLDTSDLSGDYWTNYQAEYVASGNEQFIYLGSNTPNDLITCAEPLSEGWLWNSNYVLVDNISVRIDASCGENSISGLDMSDQSVIYPNPNHGQFSVRFVNADDAVMRVFSLQGNEVFNGRINSINQQFNLDFLAPSVYVVELTNSGQVIRQRICIQ